MNPFSTGDQKNYPLRRRLRNLLRSVLVFFLFLIISCSLVYGVATIGIQRETAPWVDINLKNRTFADYSVDEQTEAVARVREDVIEDAERDALVATIAAARAPGATTTVTITPTPATSPSPTATLTPTATPADLLVDAGGPYEGEEGSRISVEANLDSLLNVVPGSVTYRWDMDNDGQFDDQRGKIASVIFFDEGDYPIRVQTTDLLGRVATDTARVLVSNVPPLARIGPDIIINEAETAFFEATAIDPGNDVLFYEWDFGDGTTLTLDTLSPEHTYRDNGDYVVRLRVSDEDEGVAEDTLLVQVLNQPPLVDAGANQTVDEGNTITLSGTATDPAGDFDTLTYEWDLDYNGSTFQPDAVGPQVSSYYPDGPKTQVAALQVQDEDGGVALDTLTVSVGNVQPDITNISNNSPMAEGSSVTVQVQATDVASDTLTYSYDWDNDGSFDLNRQLSASASHTWPDDGQYLTGVRVEDGDGGQIFATTAISIYNVAPTAIVNGPTSGTEGSTLNFNANDSSDVGDDTLTYEWDFGDGGPPLSGVDASHFYADNGVYSATLRVRDDDGGVGTNFFNVTISNVNPVAEAGGDRTIPEGETLSLDASASSDVGPNDTLSYAWDFSYNGATFNQEATGVSVSRQYLDDEIVDVALRVRDKDYPATNGEIGQSIDVIRVTVENRAPTNVNAGGPYNATEGESVTLTAATATDVASDTLTYDWDIDDDDTYELSGQSVNYTWLTQGTYPVTLRVRDEDGGETLNNTIAEISNALPIADVSAGEPYVVDENSPIVLDGRLSTDPSDLTPPTYDQLTFDWDFGDGNLDTGTTTVTRTHIYTDNNTYTVTLTVRDPDGDTDTDTTTVQVNNLPPNAVFVVSPNPVPEGTQVNFNGLSSNDPSTAPGSGIDSYLWNFGDGNSIGPGSNGLVFHTYDDEGTGVYNVQLTVTDDDGAMGTTTVPVTVTNVDPTAVITSSTITETEGTPIIFGSGNSTDPGNDTLTYSWLVDDGATNTLITTTTNITTGYAFPDQGVYTVTLEVDDGDGGLGSDVITVTIQNGPPTAVITSSTVTETEGIPIIFGSGNSTDPGNDTLTYSWLVDDGATNTLITTTTNITTTYAFPDQGVYTVTLQVDDGDGGLDSDVITVTIQNGPPTVDAGGPYTTTVGTAIPLTATGTDAVGDLPLTYNWDLDDDGLFDDGTGATVTFTTVGAPNIYTVTVQAGDGDGGVATDTTTVEVNTILPFILLGGLPYYIIKRRQRKRRNKKDIQLLTGS